MKFVSAIFIILFGFFTTAMAKGKNLDLDIRMTLYGKVSAYHFTARESERTTLKLETEHGGSFIEVIATQGLVQDNQGILMSFVVGLIDKSGDKIVISKPQIFALENQLATIATRDDKNGVEALSLTVMAKPAQGEL